MIVYYKTFLRGELVSSWNVRRQSPEDVWEYKFDKVDFCCRKMINAFDDKFIFFGEYDGYLNQDNNVNIGLCHPYPEGAVWDEMPINICPFCGKPIELIESARFTKVKKTQKIPEKEENKYIDIEVSEFTHPKDIPTDKLKGMFLMGFVTMKKMGEEVELWPFTFAASQIREELKKRNVWDSWIVELGKNKAFRNGEHDYQSIAPKKEAER